MRLPGSNNPQPPNPTPIDRTAIPKNEYPHGHPVPNNLLMKNAQGGVELVRLPLGSRLAQPMPMAQPDRSGLVNIDTLTWPANNHATNKLRGLKEAHIQSLTALNDAKMSASGVAGLSPQAASQHRKDCTAKIHDSERAERHAKRSIDVYKTRFSRELNIEADFRSTTTGEGNRNRQPPIAPGRPYVPGSIRQAPVPFAKSRQPDLPTIKERADSPESLHLRPGMKISDGTMDSAPSNLGPHQQMFEKLSGEFRSAKNEYHGMKGESSKYSKDDLALARRTYKDADHAVRTFMRSKKTELHRERKGLPEPEPKGLSGVEREGLRLALREQGREYDRFPEFPTAGTSRDAWNPPPGTMTGSRTPMEPPMTHIAPRAAEVPRPPEAIIQRPSNPTPDHSRNIGNVTQHRRDLEFGLDYYGI